MMPPVRKHSPVNPMAHLHRTVSAHRAVQEGIATHAEKERVRREEVAARKEVEALLKPIMKPSRGSLHAHPVVCRDE